MTEAASPTGVAPLPLFSRIVGVITSPKATFANIAAAPRPFGVLFVVALVIGLGSGLPQFSESMQQTMMDMQIKAAAARGPVSPEMENGFRTFAPFLPYVTIGFSLIVLPIMCLFFGALYWGIFNVVLGGTATFKQVLATVTHAMVIAGLGVLAALPFMMTSPTMDMGGPFNLGALVPMLEEGSRLAAFLGSLSVFSIWGAFVNAVGLAVLYRRGTTGIFIVVLGITMAFAFLGSLFR